MILRNPYTFIMILFSAVPFMNGQGFLHTNGKRIVNGAGEDVILRGVGTGNWMLQEGYMMKSADVAGTQHEFREKLVSTIGEVLTDSFYTVWLQNHCTRTDIDSLASWGFNSIRVAMHYKWFTPPVKEEPVPGEQTWINTGFELIDSLLAWCGENQIYLILDLHGAPGGQGTDAAISDYDPSKPSLWESQENRDKTVALWTKLAQRYSDEPWIGGYDLINETNWEFPGGNNSPLRALYGQITDSIRAVDQNHIIIIEGNWFANDFNQLTPPWDPNMVYSFHKYATYNTLQVLDWVLELRNNQNVPVWLGECGENSNTWYTNLVSLCESENIGWSMWPLKKDGINNPLRVRTNDDYLQLIDNWRGNGPMLTPQEAFLAVMEFADRHRIENCQFQRDVVDAMIRQPHTTAVKPWSPRTVRDLVFATGYDLGRNGFAYFDHDTADYRYSTGGEYTPWNSGGSYRNDGVDIEPCTDVTTNGYNVGWTDEGEWLGYTLTNDSAASFTMEVRSATSGTPSRIHVEVAGADATGPVSLPATGGWQAWTTTEIASVILPEGEVQVRVFFEKGGSNLNWFRFTNPQPVSSVPFEFVSAETAVLKNEIYLFLNKPVTSPSLFNVTDFILMQGGIQLEITEVSPDLQDVRVLVIRSSEPLLFDQEIEIAYRGNSIMHDDQVLPMFSAQGVRNLLARHFLVPGRIQAENYLNNSGLELEACSDAGGGYNTGYADVGDYLDYLIYVPEAGDYALDFRVATERYHAGLSILRDAGDGFQIIGSISFSRTGGWQNWETQSTSLHLEAEKYLLRLLVSGEEHNLNWFEFRVQVSVENHPVPGLITLYPNPANDRITIALPAPHSTPLTIGVTDICGRQVFSGFAGGGRLEIDTSVWPAGIYVISAGEGNKRYCCTPSPAMVLITTR
jgi:endoglucanase